MDYSRIHTLCAVHSEFTKAARDLSACFRPDAMQIRLDTIQQLIMEELERKAPLPKPNDDIPF